MLDIKFHRRAHKQLRHLPLQVQRRVVTSLEILAGCKHPLEHTHVIRLAGRDRMDFRLRVGDYRVKFTLIRSHDVLITHVEHRQVGY